MNQMAINHQRSKKPAILEAKIQVAQMLRKNAGFDTKYEHGPVNWWKGTFEFQGSEFYVYFKYYSTKPGVDRVDIRSTQTWEHLKPTQVKYLKRQLEQKLNGTHNGKAEKSDCPPTN